MRPIVGTAGWSIARAEAEHFPAEGSALERYSARFEGVEINSSFHRPHRVSTWERWAEQVPDHFRFSVKMPKTITHQRKLVDCGDLVAAFLEESSGLGAKLAVLLVQLPPSLAFEPELAEAFFRLLAGASSAAIACEPRHPSWFEEKSSQLLERLRVSRVAADPAPVPEAALLGGWRGLSYFRLHGSPAPYSSSYDEKRLEGYASLIRDDLAARRPIWCMFDNTASSAATGNALSLMEKLA